MNATIENTPLKRLHVLALLDHDDIVMRSALTGGEVHNHDYKLRMIAAALGDLATTLHANNPTVNRLKHIFGLATGWLISLGVSDPQSRITQERDRQEGLFRSGKINFTCASHTADNLMKLRVLIEEIGEVAEAVDKLEVHWHQINRRDHLITELIQVAAVSVAWLEALDEKPLPPGPPNPPRAVWQRPSGKVGHVQGK